MTPPRLARALAELLGWMAIAGVGGVMLTQAFSIERHWVIAALQSLTPYGIGLMAVVGGLAVWSRSHAIGIASSVVGVSVLLLATPVAFPPGQRAPRAGATEVTVAFSNLLYSNERVGEIADILVQRDPDLIVFAEYTSDHQIELVDHPLADRYPYRIDRDGLFAGGMALWSKYPVVENDRADTINRTIDASVAGPDGTIRVLAVHPPTPIYDFSSWLGDLGRIGAATAQATDPTLVIGDFNASYWHPAFRDLLRRHLTDAHMANGHGLSTSWPNDGLIPAFVRLDHALTGNGLVSTDVDDFDSPGSDHRAMVVTVAMAG